MNLIRSFVRLTLSQIQAELALVGWVARWPKSVTLTMHRYLVHRSGVCRMPLPSSVGSHRADMKSEKRKELLPASDSTLIRQSCKRFHIYLLGASRNVA
jgi:hypothetical protein